ncbi:recombination protein O N-terminal domain-containing protein [Mycoplasmopsis citelli]|uniref:recombination protein O N-terminal domain-containing protein n=1 Tax=Mycoplasmopsis citelli TaxID=171281 RepID=UPI002115114B|nr:recombination protein O N-terminal domain-containing protein [Mycoplasmopsis citelli]UUD36368.1 recombination protein O N-terminal domain-containing protein [Mycoplasmopsis citelli]
MSNITIKEAIFLNQKQVGQNEFLTTFLTSQGQVTLFAQGLNKPLSKNASNLVEGGLCIIEYFQARQKQKIGRLKKVSLLGQYNFGDEFVFRLLKRIQNMALSIHFDNEFIQTYHLVNGIFDNEHFFQVINLFLVTLIKYHQVEINVISCALCSSKRITSFDLNQGGFLCSSHCQKTKSAQLLEWIYYLFNAPTIYIGESQSDLDKIIYFLLTSFCIEKLILNP